MRLEKVAIKRGQYTSEDFRYGAGLVNRANGKVGAVDMWDRITAPLKETAEPPISQTAGAMERVEEPLISQAPAQPFSNKRVDGQSIPLMPVEAEEYQITTIHDTIGRYSDILDSLLTADIRGISMSAVGIPEQTEGLRGYEKFLYSDEVYVYPVAVDRQLLGQWEERISHAIANGEPFTEIITQHTEGEESFQFRLTPVEWSILAKEFSRYSSHVVKEHGTGELYLTVEGLYEK